VSHPVGAELLERTADGSRPSDLARVRDGGEPQLAREHEDGLVGLGRVLGLEPAEAHSDHAAIAVLAGVADDLLGPVELRAAVDVGREAHLDPVQLPCLLGAVAVAAEDLVPTDPALDALGRREDRLEVHRAVGGRFRGVVDDDLAEVLLGAQGVRGQDPDLDEVCEVAEVVQLRQAFLGVGRERIVVPAGDLEQRRRPHRPLEVDVELDLGIRHSGNGAVRVSDRQRGSR
jgi:hypothetical protein